MADQDNTVVMEGVWLIFRNFKGQEGPYNQAGSRTFAVKLDPEVAEVMKGDGWNVKELKAREEDEDDAPPQSYLPVAIRFDIRPPNVWLITSRGRRRIKEEEIEILDEVDIINVDLIVRPYPWEVRGETGLKAYVKSLYVTILEDALELKYGEMEESPGN
jgi:hypothetical protein